MTSLASKLGPSRADVEVVVSKLAAVVVMLMVGACVVEDDAGGPSVDRATEVALADTALVEQDATAELCTLAAALPADDLCSLVCDADAFAARLAASGMDSGACYQFRCTLSPEVTVGVGVCLP